MKSLCNRCAQKLGYCTRFGWSLIACQECGVKNSDVREWANAGPCESVPLSVWGAALLLVILAVAITMKGCSL